MDTWNSNARSLIDSSVKSRELIKSKLKGDWTSASEETAQLTATTNAVHGETVRIVDGQMAQMAVVEACTHLIAGESNDSETLVTMFLMKSLEIFVLRCLTCEVSQRVREW